MSVYRIPFGIHKGKNLTSIPASYLLWLVNDGLNVPQEIKDYVKNNKDSIVSEAQNERGNG
jgi:hypothetical protein